MKEGAPSQTEIRASRAKLDRLLARPSRTERHQNYWEAFEVDAQPLEVDASQLDPSRVSTLENAGFVPVCTLHQTFFGVETESEIWTHRDVVFEQLLTEDRWFLTTYYDDGSAVSLWPDESTAFAHGMRVTVGSTGELHADLERFSASREEFVSERGGAGLLVPDVGTVVALIELHNRFLVHDDVVALARWATELEAAADRAAMASGRWFLWEFLAQAAVAAVAAWILGQWGWLVVALVIGSADAALTMWTRRRNPVLAVARWLYVAALGLVVAWSFVDTHVVLRKLAVGLVGAVVVVPLVLIAQRLWRRYGARGR